MLREDRLFPWEFHEHVWMKPLQALSMLCEWSEG